ncbi:NAD(P)-dependent oxidoreductase [Caballeronia sordidicola]|uniref:NAD(P)-dependent oxidoreductase n=1 Tax=Caballeronia sordidicola TaxID=196367 RepID=UPI000A83F297|nr:NAD(P)-binding domain-containing protein [Caballeronia sordidicola]
MSKVRTVALIGLGAMGTALAQAFIRGGFSLTVWNRTAARMDVVVKDGASGAKNAAAAVAASPLIVICTIDKSVAAALLQQADVASSLAGKTVVNLSTGSVDEARAISKFVESSGGSYIDGGIMCYPRDIGKPATSVLYSGNAAAFEEHKEALAFLGGNVRYLGSDPGTAPTIYLALYAFYFGCVASFFEGAALAERAGVTPEAFRETSKIMLEVLNEALPDATRRIKSEDYSGEQASIDVHHAGQLVVRDAYKAENMVCKVTNAYIAYLERAQKAGDGPNDIATMYRAVKSTP